MAGISKKKIKKGEKVIIKYTITYRDIFGKQHTSGLYDTIKEAKKDLGKFENINPDVKNITYGAVFQMFLEKVERKNSRGTYLNYINYFSNFTKILNISYLKITSISWQSFFDDIEKLKGPHVAQGCLKFARAAANYGIRHNLIEFNVFNKIEKAELPKADINHLTIKEIKQVLDECKKSYPEYYPLLYVFCGTGAREGEIFALTKEDFNYKEKSILINKQFTKNKLYLKPKTEQSNRKIYIFEELAEILKNHIKKLDKDNPLLFPNRAGNYHNSSNFRVRFWYKLLEICKIKKRVRLHDLRGSYIDLLLSMGLSVKFAQNQVGHSKSETTLNIYAKNNQDMINSAQNILSNVFEKCEHNVRINENPLNNKIIPFPKKQSGTGF